MDNSTKFTLFYLIVVFGFVLFLLIPLIPYNPQSFDSGQEKNVIDWIEHNHPDSTYELNYNKWRNGLEVVVIQKNNTYITYVFWKNGKIEKKEAGQMWKGKHEN